MITIIRIAINTANKINFLILKIDDDFFLNEEDPHLEHTILPPKDRSETNEYPPQFIQTLLTLINKTKGLYTYYINLILCKEKLQKIS